MAKYVSQGGLGRLVHSRRPVQIGQQDVIRMNRDTIYSGGVFDLEEPVTITLPKGDGRFQSLQVVNQDHYVVMVEHDPGTYEITREEVGTRYVVVIIRTFMDPGNEADIAAANGLQEQIEVSQSLAGEFKVPEWDATRSIRSGGSSSPLPRPAQGGLPPRSAQRRRWIRFST